MIININDFGGGGKGLSFEIVESLPTEGKKGIIYLIESEDPSESDKFEEYIWVDGEWEKFGKMPKIDLEDYYTKEECDDKFLTEHQTLKTINGETIVGEGDITIESGDEHFKYDPVEEFSDGIVVYSEDLTEECVANKPYEKGKRFKINGYPGKLTAYLLGWADSAPRGLFQITKQQNQEIEINSGGWDREDNIIVYLNGVEYARHNGSKDLILNLPYSDDYEYEYVVNTVKYNAWGFTQMPDPKPYFVLQNKGAYLAKDGEKKEIALKESVERKQDTLVSGTNIKTINGESVLGSGDFSFYTKDEIDTKIGIINNELENIIG